MDKYKDWDVNSTTDNDNIFGLPHKFDDANVIFIPIRWSEAASEPTETDDAPDLILEQSKYIDLGSNQYPHSWKYGAFWHQNNQIRHAEIIKGTYKGEVLDRNLENTLFQKDILSALTHKMFDDKIVCVVGGDHSVALPNILSTYKKCNGELTILHFDAHPDLRNTYEGIEFSHASVFRHVMTQTECNLIQVGVRDMCQEEIDYANEHSSILAVEARIINAASQGLSNHTPVHIINNIITWLIEHEKSKNIYVSFDIDVLCPSLCPNTGTPVIGGISIEFIMNLLELITNYGYKIRGFDLVETGNHDFDARIAAQVLWKLFQLTSKNTINND